MVAIFTGQGAGFQRGSGASLGGAGLLGSAGLGRSGEQAFLNAATGNFLVTQRDEFLVGRGPDVAISRTYNSRGALDENGDHWRQSTDRRVFGLTGTANTAGSTVTRVSSDGSEITYSWNGSVYETTDGAGSYDHLSYSGGVWTWRDGDSQVTETYAAYGTDNWRITTKTDRDGNALSFTYVGDKLSRVTTANGEYTQYSWSGNNITQITTGYTDLSTSTAKTLTRTRYTYDGSNRLRTVTVDFSPEDNSVTDSNVYTTTYTYHGISKQIATISQTDGSSLAIAYNASGQVETLTQTVASGETRVTALEYKVDPQTGERWTEITDARGQITKLYYDADNQLSKIVSPPPVSGGTPLETTFTYDSIGNVTSVTDPAGAVTQYRYDAQGNVSYVRYPNGSTTLRTYDSDNHVTQEIKTGASITLPGTATNQAPVAATNSITVTQALGGALDLDLAALFSDPGDTLTFTPTGLPAGVSFTGGRYLTGTPSSTGTYTIGVSASDGSLSASKSFTLTVTAPSNLAPVAAASVDSVTQTEGGSLTLDLADLFVDPEAGSLTYSATNIPAGLSLSGSVLSGIPTTAGTYTLTVSAGDGTNVTQKSVTITVQAALAKADDLLKSYPRDARLHFLRGSILVGAGKPIEAYSALSRAVDIAPDFAIARFQLGFFQLTSGEANNALATWGPLEQLEDGHYLRLFVEGLRHLIADDFDMAFQLLGRGMKANTENPPLNRDMQLLIDRCRDVGRIPDNDSASVEAEKEGEEESVSATSFLLGQLLGRGRKQHN